MDRRRTLTGFAAFSVAIAGLLITAQAALASSGGLLGEVSDKTITFVFFAVIVFFPLMITVLSLIQGRLEARKDRRRYDLERFG